MPSWSPARSLETRLRRLAMPLYRISLTSVDLPEPETPVTQVKADTGKATSMPRRLCMRAPRTVNHSSGRRRWPGRAMLLRPARKSPVSEAGSSMIWRGVPSATTLPPCSPAPGPMSTMWSAERIVSSSCSTTMTVLPRSRRRSSVSMRRRLSRWCRPMLGSSRMYSTPTSAEPICVARRMRCASPPRQRGRGALQREIADADVVEEGEALADLLDDASADEALRVAELQAPCRKPSASRTLISVKSLMLRSPSVTARLVGLSRAPLHSGHGLSAMYSSIFWRTCSDSVSAKRRCRCLRMPWKLAV